MKIKATCLAVIACGCAVWLSRPPVAVDVLNDTSPVLQDMDGGWINAASVDDGRWRFKADLDQIDPAFVEALVEVEDRRYFQHAGVDIPAIARAAKDWAKEGRVVSGASTITMQLVRQYKPRPRTLWSKAIETAEAIRFELHYSKADILEQYLTRVSYGGNIEGVEAASRIYLGKSPQYLTPDEIALLIALPQAPEARRPDRHAWAAQKGRARILSRMKAAGLITADTQDEADTASLPLVKYDLPNDAWLTARALTSRGQTVRSTLDPALQTALTQRLSRVVAETPKTVNASAIIIHAPSRKVRAHAAIGRRDHDGGWLDMTRAVRSPGSTLKPFVYGLGLDDGLATGESLMRDAPTRFGSYRPENFEKRHYGDITLAQALQHSLNVPAVTILDKVGGRRMEAILNASGAKISGGAPSQDSSEAGLALALGGTGLTGLDIAMLYTALANDGQAAPLVWRSDIDAEETSQALMRPETARELVQILADAPRPDGFVPGRLTRGSGSIAYKTGTSYGFRDAWAAGIAGEYVIVVWIGRPDGAPRPGQTGRLAAAPILFDIAADLPVSEKSDFVAPHKAAALRAVGAPDSKAPLILFPAKNAELALAEFGENGRGVKLQVQSAHGDVIVHVDGQPVLRTRDGYIFNPDGPGFYKIEARDNLGGITKQRFRILSAQDIRDAPL